MLPALTKDLGTSISFGSLSVFIWAPNTGGGRTRELLRYACQASSKAHTYHRTSLRRTITKPEPVHGEQPAPRAAERHQLARTAANYRSYIFCSKLTLGPGVHFGGRTQDTHHPTPLFPPLLTHLNNPFFSILLQPHTPCTFCPSRPG